MKERTIRVSVFVAISLDGFIAKTDGNVDWLDEFESLADGEDAGYGELFNAVDSMIMGRRTFEKILTFDWPYGKKSITVMSSSLKTIPKKLRGSVRISASSPIKLLEKLEAEGQRHIYLDGGQLIQSFLRDGLVDDLTLTMIPILLGEGIPLFGHLKKDIRLELLKTRSWENGFVQTKYRVVA